MNFEKEQIWRRLTDKTGNYYCELAEPEREEFRNGLKELLYKEEVLIEFTKADGTDRDMKCTLNYDLIPIPPDIVSTTGRVDGIVLESKKPLSNHQYVNI